MSRMLSLSAVCYILCAVIGLATDARAQPAFDGEFLVDTSGTHQEIPSAVAFGGTNYLVVWTDWRRGGENTDIYGCRVTSSGAVLDPQGITISMRADIQKKPAVAFDGTNYFVVWQDHLDGDTSKVYGCRVTPSGTVLDPDGIYISRGPGFRMNPELAFDGANFLVVWQETPGSGRYDIYGSRVTPMGAVLEPQGIAISTATNHQQVPDLAFDGVNFLVVWMDGRSGSYDVYGSRVTPAGEVLDSQGIAILVGLDEQLDPVAAFGGASYLVAWEDYRNGSATDVYGCRVTPSGTVLDPQGIAISTAEHNQGGPCIGFDGADFLVVWSDKRGGNGYDIYGCRVRPDGTAFSDGPVVVQEGAQSAVGLAADTGGRMFLVYSGWTGTVGGKTYDVNRVWGKMDPNPGVEEVENSEVGSGKGATVVRGVLWLTPASDPKPQASSSLLDISGRRVMELQAGPNAVSRLAPGVYFVRDARAQAQAVRKVVITR